MLVLHGVSTARVPEIPAEAQPDLTVEDLRAILTWLSKRFRLLSPRELFESSTAGVLLTFDDGFANAATNVLPVLDEFDAPAIFFVTTQHVAAPRDWLRFVRRQASGFGPWTDPAVRAGGARRGRVRRDVDGAASGVRRPPFDHDRIPHGETPVSHALFRRGAAHGADESRRFLEEATGRPVDLSPTRPETMT